MSTVVNVEMAAAWDGDEGDDWARDWQRYDRAVDGYRRTLVDAACIGPADGVLDVGCGNGQSTRDAARVAVRGAALGVDLSSRMIARARELARIEGLDNAAFEQVDAQSHPFGGSRFDAVLSRFGASFFADPAAAFANIRAAMYPGARLAMVTWREMGDNEWLQCVRRALACGRVLPAPPPGAPGPLGLADPARARATLTAAGFDAVELTAVDRPFWVGADADDAFAFFRGTGIVRGMTQDLDEAGKGRALEALHAAMVDHDSGQGVWFGSGAWLVIARRSAP